LLCLVTSPDQRLLLAADFDPERFATLFFAGAFVIAVAPG
jgi:hypothetical protein